MHHGQSEIVILKPTSVFLSFLASQLPEKSIPSFKLLHTDNTAYVIPKHINEEDTLEEIEKNFSMMFHHEISRWLGKNVYNEIESSFIDFLCCFKFEFHTHIILMEPSLKEGHQLLNIKPRSVFLNWLKEESAEEAELIDVLDQVSLNQIIENSTVLVKNFKNIKEIKPFVEQYYKPIFETSMSRMCGNSDEWPIVSSFKQFNKYFEIEIHTQLIHLH